MNKKSKIILILGIIAILIIGIATFFMLNPKEIKVPRKGDDVIVTTANTNSGVTKEQTVSGLKISNVMLVVKEEGSTFTADVTNTTDKEIQGTLDIIFKTSTNKEVTSILGYFGNSIKPGETKQISTNTSRQLNENIIKSVDYKLNK